MLARNRSLSTLIVGCEGVKTKLLGCDPMGVFLGPETLDDVPHKNYKSSKVVVTNMVKERCTFRWAVHRPNGSSMEERYVRLDEHLILKTLEGGKCMREYRMAFFKIGVSNPFLTIGPVYGLLSETGEPPHVPHFANKFFKRHVEDMLQERNMSFLRYLDR